MLNDVKSGNEKESWYKWDEKKKKKLESVKNEISWDGGREKDG